MADTKIKVTDEIAAGKHATDVIITTTEKDLSALFYVYSGLDKKEGIATAKIYMSHTTALQLADIILKQLGPAHQKYKELQDKLKPDSEDSSTD